MDTGGGSADVLTIGLGATFTVARGEGVSKPIRMERDSTLDNAGAVGGDLETAVESIDGAALNTTVLNHDGGTIRANGTGVLFHATGTVRNTAGGVIESRHDGIGLDYGGQVFNDGAGSIIRSSNGIAVDALGEAARVENTHGATIVGYATAIYLEHGGTVTNGAGSTIEATDTNDGACGRPGACSILVGSDSQTPYSAGGELTLANAGIIIGNVQMISTAANAVTLLAGSSIQGDLSVGSNHGSSLALDGGAGTVQSYMDAVTGTTTFAGDLAKVGEGTWIIDGDLTPDFTTVSQGTLQVGDGGTRGSIGQADIMVYHGKLVFNRSDDVTFQGALSSGGSTAYDGALVQAGSGTLTLTSTTIRPSSIEIQRGTLQFGNTGDLPGSDGSGYPVDVNIANNGSLVFDSNYNIFFSGAVSGSGSVTQNGSAALIMQAPHTYTGGTTINNGAVWTMYTLPGDVTVNAGGQLTGFTQSTPMPGLPGVAGQLSNAGIVTVRARDTVVGGDYSQGASGTLAVSLGSKLDVAGTATLQGGTLEITGADSGYVSNTHTTILNAAGGLTGKFDRLVKDSGVVFTATTINYDGTSAWLDTTGLNVTTAAAGAGVNYTPASMGSAVRVQGAFQQLDTRIAAGDLAGVSADFLRSAGEFQQAPSLLAAQASLQSLSGELHAVSAAMTFEAVDASSRALSDRFDALLEQGSGVGMWTHNVSLGGGMARAGFEDVDFQLDGWLVGSDRMVGSTGVAGFAFGQSRGRQQLSRRLDRDVGRHTEGMLYAGRHDGRGYLQGRVGFGQFRQDVTRQLLLGYHTQEVGARYDGRYSTAYGESGLHLGGAGYHLTPFIDAQYTRIDRNGFAEQGAGGFGLRTNAQVLDRWQAGVGVRAARHWELSHGRAVDISARAEWRRTLATRGAMFDASFVGLEQWQRLLGIGLSRYSGLLGIGMDATLSRRATLKINFDYEQGQHTTAQALSTRLQIAF